MAFAINNQLEGFIIKGKYIIDMVVIAFVEFAALDTCLCQTYYFTGGAGGTGYQEIPFADPGNPNYGYGNGNGGGRFPGSSGSVNFGPLNGTLIYDPGANTMELLGNAGISGSWNGSGDFSDNQTINGVLVPATVSVNYTVGNVDDGVFSFDTGAVPFNPAGPNSFDVPLPISGSYSLVTGGETYSGTYSYTLSISTVVHYSVINSNSVDFSMDTVGDDLLFVPLAQITADNGVQVDLTAEDPSDGVTYQEWHADNVDAVVPEPSASEMLVLAFSGLGLYVCRRASARRRCIRYK